MALFEARNARREIRDPRSATAKMQFSGSGVPQINEWNSEAAIKEAYLLNSYVYACVEKLANAVAGATLVISTKPQTAGTHDVNSPLARLLRAPNPDVTTRSLIAYSVAQRMVTGQWAWEYEFETRGVTPVGLYPLSSAKLDPIPSEGGRYYFDGFRYRTPGRRLEKSVLLKRSDILYAWLPGPSDFRQPLSPLQAARLDVSVAVMDDRFQYAFLKNDMRPSNILVTPEFEDRDEYERFKHQTMADHGGIDNAGKTMFAEYDGEAQKDSISVIKLGQSQRDSQTVQMHMEKLKGICVALEVPMSMLDASGRTFNNGGIEYQNFYEGPVLRIAQEMAEVINNQLAPLMGNETVWFNFDHIAALRPPQKFMQVSPVDLVSADIVSKSEVREELGLNPDEAPDDLAEAPVAKLSDRATAALALVQAGYDPAAVLTATGFDAMPVAPKPETLALPTQVPGDAANPPQRSGESTTETRAVDRSEIRAKAAKVTEMHTAALEASFKRSMAALFERQRVATLDRLTGKRGRRMAENRAPGDEVSASDIFDANFWKATTAEIATHIYDAIFATGGTRVADQFGLSFDMAAPKARDYVASRANQLAGRVTDTTHGQITDALNAGIANGEGIPDLAARVGGVFDATAARSELIARTETVSAYNGAKDEVAASMPSDVVSHKEWVATSDARTRDDHQSADGQIVAVDDTFQVGGESMQYPGDPGASADETANCRCTLNHLSPEDAAAATDDRNGITMEFRKAEQAIRDAAIARVAGDPAIQAAAVSVEA